MAIPYGHQSINDDDVQAVVKALTSDWLTTGPAVSDFEEAICRVAEAEEAVVVSSGTAALHCAYIAADVGPDDEVVTSPLTFMATAATAANLGAKVVFADVQEDTGNIDPDAVADAVSDRTRVVAAVDFAGHPADLDPLLDLAHDRGALLLEDAAHSIGSMYRDRAIGSVADLTTFSFFATKNLTTAEGGAIVGKAGPVMVAARECRNHGLVRDKARQRHPDEGPWHQEVHRFGLNFRLPDVLCALGSSQLARLAVFKQRRREIFDRYQQGLDGVPGVKLPVLRDDVDPMWHLYPLRILEGRRRQVYDFLREQGVLVQVNYLPAYWHPAFEDLGYRRGICPVAERYYHEELSLPMYADLSPGEQDRVIDLVRQAVR